MPDTGTQLPGHPSRRSARVLIRVPVEVRFAPARGPSIREETQTSVISRHGALLRLSAAPAPGSTLELMNKSSDQVEEFRVVWVDPEPKDGFYDVAVEMLCSSDTFWGIRFAREGEN